MATFYNNVHIFTYSDNGNFERLSDLTYKLSLTRQGECIVLDFYVGDNKKKTFEINTETEYSRLGKQGLVITNDQDSLLVKFPSIHILKSFQHRVKQLKDGLKSAFSERTDEASAVQYFQFYGYLSQQQNMMQDYIRTATYQRAILSSVNDFQGKVVLDVGAGSGILSFFALQAGAKKVYAVEASSMAQHCELLVKRNNFQGKIEVVAGKIEEIELPEKVDTIISEPMGYMLFNERMLETFLHAKKWLKPGGKMMPTYGDLHIAPFTDEALFMEQYTKANFWQQESFYGINLTSLRAAAVKEYFKQPIVDTFDMRICLAKSMKHPVDFQTADETDLHKIEIPLSFTMNQTGVVHGLAFWFEVAFIGTDSSIIWLSTAPTEPLTHWYQVRCLVETPVFVKQGQMLTGHVTLKCNTRQSYDVNIDLDIPGTTAKSKNNLDLKNPFFRYTGQTPQPPPGSNTQSPSESYWSNYTSNQQQQQQQQQQQIYHINSLVNGTDEAGQNLGQGAGTINVNQLQNQALAAPVNPGCIPSIISLVSSTGSNGTIQPQTQTSIGGGISPINFTSFQSS